MMNLDAKIYVAGHRGLVGSAIARELRGAGYRNIVLRTRAELNLTNEAAVRGFFAIELPLLNTGEPIWKTMKTDSVNNIHGEPDVALLPIFVSSCKP